MMMVDMGGPGAIEGYEPPCIDGATEDVFRDEVTLIPSDDLLFIGKGEGVLPLAHVAEPLMVSVDRGRGLY
jgi:hypothetical protein